jgi:hypothetical protein
MSSSQIRRSWSRSATNRRYCGLLANSSTVINTAQPHLLELKTYYWCGQRLTAGTCLPCSNFLTATSSGCWRPTAGNMVDASGDRETPCYRLLRFPEQIHGWCGPPSDEVLRPAKPAGHTLQRAIDGNVSFRRSSSRIVFLWQRHEVKWNRPVCRIERDRFGVGTKVSRMMPGTVVVVLFIH